MKRQWRINGVGYNVRIYGTGEFWFYKTPEDFSDVWRNDNLTPTEIAVKFNLPNNNMVSQRFFKFKRRLKTNKKFKKLSVKIKEYIEK